MNVQNVNIIKDGSYYKRMCPCETCGTPRYLRCTKTNLVTTYRPNCNKCTLNKNRPARKNKIVDEFKIIDTPEKSYIFGFLWADGHLKFGGNSSGNSIKLCIHAQDEAVLDFIIKHIGGKKFNRDYIDKNTNKIVLRRTWELNSNNIYKNFNSLNFRKNINAVPEEYISHFIRGLIDGDGCYSIKQNKNWIDSIFITSDYNQDWSFLSNIDKIKNHIIKRYVKSNGKVSLFYISGNQQDKIDFLKWIYQNSSFHFDRKYNKIHKFL